jgi:hypothetical protein
MRVLSSGVGVVGGVALTAIVAFGIDGRIAESSQSSREQKIEIVNDPQPFVFGASPRDLGRPFNSCSPAQPARIILEVIGHDAKRVLVHHYESAAWRDIGVVRDYIRRVLSAVPEPEHQRGTLCGRKRLELRSSRLSNSRMVNGGGWN